MQDTFPGSSYTVHNVLVHFIIEDEDKVLRLAEREGNIAEKALQYALELDQS